MHGHREARRVLEVALPPVTLLTGPQSIGKRTLARHLCAHHGIDWFDRFEVDPPLSIDTVRRVAGFVARRPHGPRKAVIAALDGASTPALHALLKPLEETPEDCHFLLTAATATLATVTSRAQVFRLGALPDADVVEVLCGQGVPRPVAVRVAPYGNGQVEPALRIARGIGSAAERVTDLVTALHRHDRAAFAGCFTHWSDTDTTLLLTLVCEAITGRFQIFTEADTGGLHRDQATARRMLLALSAYTDARSRLGVRAALEPFI